MIVDAFEREEHWQDGARAALASLLVLFDNEPLLARIWFVDALAAGSWALERRAHNLALLRSTIVERFWRTPGEERPRPLILAGLGVMAVDAAVAAIVIGVREAYGFWIVALVLLGLSLGVAVRVLRLPGTEQNGPLVAEILEARRANDDDTIEEQLLDDLAHETFANENALARKDPLVASAVTCLILGIVVEFAAQVLQ